MPPKTYRIKVLRGSRTLTELGPMVLDLGADVSRHQLTNVLTDAIKAHIGAGRLSEVWRYSLQIREQGKTELAMTFRATYAQVRGV